MIREAAISRPETGDRRLSAFQPPRGRPRPAQRPRRSGAQRRRQRFRRRQLRAEPGSVGRRWSVGSPSVGMAAAAPVGSAPVAATAAASGAQSSVGTVAAAPTTAAAPMRTRRRDPRCRVPGRHSADSGPRPGGGSSRSGRRCRTSRGRDAHHHRRRDAAPGKGHVQRGSVLLRRAAAEPGDQPDPVVIGPTAEAQARRDRRSRSDKKKKRAGDGSPPSCHRNRFPRTYGLRRRNGP